MNTKQATPDYQSIAVDFAPGDLVVPFGANRDTAGRVVAVWPAIGMVDVEYPMGARRLPVEDIVRLDEKGNPVIVPEDYVPGGAGTVSVSGGPGLSRKALYWAARDRQYKATNEETSSSSFLCPRCKQPLSKATYRHVDGVSEKLFGCRDCLFLIDRSAILGVEG